MSHHFRIYYPPSQAVHSGKGLDFDGVVYSPPVYREKPSVEADIRVGMSLWHFLEEDQGAGRCYHGSVKALRGASNCIVEYTLAERFPESQGRNASWDYGKSASAGRGGAGGWSGAGSRSDANGRRSEGCWASYYEEVCVSCVWFWWACGWSVLSFFGRRVDCADRLIDVKGLPS